MLTLDKKHGAYVIQDDPRCLTCAGSGGGEPRETVVAFKVKESNGNDDELPDKPSRLIFHPVPTNSSTSSGCSCWDCGGVSLFSSLKYICCFGACSAADMNAMICFTPCKPRFRRLVDAIYPRAINEGLINMQMQKLTYYAICNPEKLERIGEYLVMRMWRDLTRLRFVQVKIAVEAMDQLLEACHGSPSLPQFAENHLKMVQKLLENNTPEMELLGTASFVRFSNIEESTPAYHREYDFFICKFAQMCHARGVRWKQMRAAGLRGLRGVVWKAVTEGLHQPLNIWERAHMDMIVPSILFNLQSDDECAAALDPSNEPVDASNAFTRNRSNTKAALVDTLGDIGEERDRDDPRALSDQCLRELMGKATFGSLRAVLEPVLKHLDLHQKWLPPPTFAIQVFRAIIYSIQTQNSYFVIQELINHLDTMTSSGAAVRIGIASVISSIVGIAGTTIGPLLLSIFSSLLKHLRTSVEFQQSKQCPNLEDEATYQETLINAMGDFANALPDYQKVEMMMFTVGSITNLHLAGGNAATPLTAVTPSISTPSGGGSFSNLPRASDAFLQHVLVKTLLKVSTKYRTAYLATVFSDSFLRTLIRLALVDDKAVRLTTLRIFHTLLDRHDNLNQVEHLPYVVDVADLQLTVEKCSRADQMFMKKHVADITGMLYQSVVLVEEEEEVSLKIVFDAIQCVMVLLCIEVGYDEVLMELFRVSFALQGYAVDSSETASASTPSPSSAKRVAVHNMLARFFNLSSQLLALPSLCQHVRQVIKTRAKCGPEGTDLLEGARIEEENGEKSGEEESSQAETQRREASEGDEDAIDIDELLADEPEERCSLEEMEKIPSLLFNRDDVAECLKAAGKDVSRLLAPLNYSSMTPNRLIAMTGTGTGRPDLLALSSVTIHENEDGRGRFGKKGGDGALDVDSLDISLDDWSGDNESGDKLKSGGSRRGTVFSISSGQLLSKVNPTGLPISVNDLRSIINNPVDRAEQEKKAMEVTACVVEQLRSRPFDDVVEEVSRQNEENDVLRTVSRLLARNAETVKINEIGRPGKKPKNIFEMELPSRYIY